MSGIPRIPRDMDPRRPRHRQSEESSNTPARSYGQSAEPPGNVHDDIDEFEDLTDEPVREGDESTDDRSGAARSKQKRKLREFEDLAGEPVLDEDPGEKK